MAIATSIAIAAGVVAAGAAASSIAKKNALKRAASAQKRGIQQQDAILRKKLDPAALNRFAQQVDRERALNRIELQRDVDPEIAELREFSKKQLLEISQQDESAKQSTQVANQIFRENIEADPRMERLKDTIVARAQEDFDAGATLPPEFQAELVRAGIQTGAQAGVGTSGRTVGGVTSRLLGSAGIALQQQRAQEGVALASAADNLVRSRQQILSNIFPTVKVQEDAKYGRAVQNLGIAEGLLPEAGISGNAAIDIEIGRQKGFANLAAQRGQVRAGEAAARGEFTAGLIGAGTSLATAGLGAFGSAGSLASAGGSGINYGSLSQSVLGGVGSLQTNNPFFGSSPGQVPYSYQGDPNILVNRRYI